MERRCEMIEFINYCTRCDFECEDDSEMEAHIAAHEEAEAVAESQAAYLRGDGRSVEEFFEELKTEIGAD